MKPNETMAYLAERVRTLVGDDPRITEKTMFGGLTFLLNGHVLVGTRKDGRILVCVGKENAAAAAVRPGATAMVHNGRIMTGFFWVDPEAIEDDDDLARWVDFALKAVSAKPPKAEKRAKNKATRAPSKERRPTRTS